MSLNKMALMRHPAQLKMPFAQVRIKKTTVCPFPYPSAVSLPQGDVILAQLACPLNDVILAQLACPLNDVIFGLLVE